MSTALSKFCPLPDNSSHCTVCPVSVSTSQFTVCMSCVSLSTAVFYILSTAFQYPTMPPLLICVPLSTTDFYSLHCLSVRRTLPSLGSLSLSPLIYSTVRPLSVSTSICTVCYFCVTASTAVFYSLSNICQ